VSSNNSKNNPAVVALVRDSVLAISTPNGGPMVIPSRQVVDVTASVFKAGSDHHKFKVTFDVTFAGREVVWPSRLDLWKGPETSTGQLAPLKYTRWAFANYDSTHGGD